MSSVLLDSNIWTLYSKHLVYCHIKLSELKLSLKQEDIGITEASAVQVSFITGHWYWYWCSPVHQWGAADPLSLPGPGQTGPRLSWRRSRDPASPDSRPGPTTAASSPHTHPYIPHTDLIENLRNNNVKVDLGFWIFKNICFIVLFSFFCIWRSSDFRFHLQTINLNPLPRIEKFFTKFSHSDLCKLF